MTGPLKQGYVDTEAAAHYLGLQPSTLVARRQRGDGPPYVRLSSRCIRYSVADLERFAAERTRNAEASVELEPAADAAADAGPVVHARLVYGLQGERYVVTCPYCGREHIHGAEDGPRRSGCTPGGMYVVVRGGDWARHR
jgi:hypothetical protein